MLDFLLKVMRCAFRNKLRSILTVTGVAVGAASVILVSSVGNAGINAIDREMTGMGMDSLVISADGLNEESLNVIKNMSNVSNAMPLMNKVTTMNINSRDVASMVWGVNEKADKVIDLDVKYGRLINRGDIVSRNRVCVVDEAAALSGYDRSDIVGKHISVILNGTEQDFEVIGVVKNGVNMLQNMLGGFIPDFIYIPYTVMQQQTDIYDFDNITVRLDDAEKSEETALIIENYLEYTDTSPKVENLLKQKDKMNNIMGIASAALSVVAGISIVVSGISIMTVMLVSVSERTREIGIKRSVGATTWNIVSEFLTEAVIITVSGGGIGIAAGVVLSLLLCSITGVPFVFDVKNILTVFGVSICTGIIFGAYPAAKAAKLNPADALRQE